ncbi:PQQ-dependent sugar dehydrogenase [Rhodococcus hoagii]|uniref:PQQ-dependent sugar dehydrogenase n=1 Tax=Rhodococcus hoagii TaxID=43767 RepID=A0A9Q4ZG88_RHOHA|nr:PQQ-dependent sugar dehydrogenase [Prescottella equi]MBM4472607.1 PQQ-dependent sugar dehydrogenase [Prescottella equi]MBM4479869.1 PQQ-dependent sugar dehydrogenase [Prescottella equi]MBM4491644.1 PQQ-dependent sugar dehydrogenase [Prescottella equi]MBM4498154.1 PQQ-dependent sugar dehydrogenase [Prescottella equi]
MRRSTLGAGAAVAAAIIGIGVAPTACAEPAPPLQVTTVMDGLAKPWDVVVAPDGAILTGERAGRFVVKRPDGTVGEMTADLSDLYAEGETGLMGIALASDFATSRTVYTCQGHRQAGGGSLGAGSLGSADAGTDIRVVSWTADPEWTTLTRTGDVLTGIPTGAGGRHGGCRILAHPDGTLYIGTGDTASPTVPQDRNSLGGKVLHVDADGSPAAGNPFPDSPVFTLGHRNVQGLALQPGTGRIYGIEQGTSRDDEVNLLDAGNNYGYRPDRAPFIYDESVPMTDPVRVPGAVAAVWSSGAPTLATPGGTFVSGAAWGEWDGALAVTTQQGREMLLLKLTADGTAVTETDSVLTDQGRLRSATRMPDGSLLVTTDNGTGDKVLRVAPTTS